MQGPLNFHNLSSLTLETFRNEYQIGTNKRDLSNVCRHEDRTMLVLNSFLSISTINVYGKKITTKPQALITHLATTVSDAHSECSCKVHSSSIEIQTFYNTMSTAVYLQISQSSLLIQGMLQNQKAIT